jgi:hypothetical protein
VKSSRLILVLLSGELSHAGIPGRLHCGYGGVAAGTVEYALLTAEILVEVLGRNVEETAAAAGQPVLSPGGFGLLNIKGHGLLDLEVSDIVAVNLNYTILSALFIRKLWCVGFFHGHR